MFFENKEEIKQILEISIDRDRQLVELIENTIPENLISSIEESFEELDYLIESREYKNIILSLFGL